MDNVDGIDVGQNLGVDVFKIGDLVTVSGNSKGKGFAGHMKRHGFSGGRRSHGKNSVMRKAGSIGAGTDPGRVWKGTRMAGRMGGDNVSIKNISIVRKSLVAKNKIRSGEIFSSNNITVKRPANGISPMQYWKIIGTEAKKDYEEDEPI